MKSFGTVAIILALGVIAWAQVSGDLAELADAERAFAAETVKHGFRDGFIKFFADDGIGFGPHPERTKGILLKQKPETGPRGLIFEWAPIFGDISAAGDMGYTTGPVLFTPQGENAKSPFHGIYFSVWQKQADGGWKVAIDLGVDTPEAVAAQDAPFVAADLVKRATNGRVSSLDDYRKLDATFWSAIARTNPVKAYLGWLDKQFRVHRKGRMPVTDAARLGLVLKQTKFEFIDGKIARSNDLAFTYGKYSTMNEPSGDESGYYVHVWRRNQANEWRLVADVQNPLPKDR